MSQYARYGYPIRLPRDLSERRAVLDLLETLDRRNLLFLSNLATLAFQDGACTESNAVNSATNAIRSSDCHK